VRVRTQLDGGRVVALVGMDGRVQFISRDTAKAGLAWQRNGKGPTDWALVPARCPLQVLPYRKKTTTRPHRPPLRLVHTTVKVSTEMGFEKAVLAMGSVWNKSNAEATILVGPARAAP